MCLFKRCSNLLGLNIINLHTFSFQFTKLQHSAGSKEETYSMCGQRSARTQSPTTKNYAVELPPFGVFTGVSQSEVQWKGLTLGAPPS